jgi:tRNA(Ile)-lysidine synthase
LHPDAAEWAAHCQNVCSTLDIPFIQIAVDAHPQPGESPEEAARNARYAAFDTILKPGDLIVLAQHREDQAETVLLQLLRGSGLEGISAMPQAHRLGDATVLRPLIDVDLAHIRAYATEHRLLWIEDPSNLDIRFDRNYLRNVVMPLLKERWPATTKVLSRTARHAAHSAQAQKSREKELVHALAPEGHLDLAGCRELSPYDQSLAIRGWFRSMSLRMPSEKRVQCLIHDFLKSSADRTPEIRLPDGTSLYRFRDRIYRIESVSSPLACRWNDWPNPIMLPGDNGMLATSGQQPPTSTGVQPLIEIRYRRGGEKIQIEGRNGHRELGNLCHEAGIPYWVRNRLPLIYVDEKLVAIADLWINTDGLQHICPEFKALKYHWSNPEGLDPTGALNALRAEGA